MTIALAAPPAAIGAEQAAEFVEPHDYAETLAGGVTVGPAEDHHDEDGAHGGIHEHLPHPPEPHYRMPPPPARVVVSTTNDAVVITVTTGFGFGPINDGVWISVTQM